MEQDELGRKHSGQEKILDTYKRKNAVFSRISDADGMTLSQILSQKIPGRDKNHLVGLHPDGKGRKMEYRKFI